VISETMARQAWPGEDPIGKRIVSRAGGPPQAREVVGVVGDVRHGGHAERVRPGYYVPHAQWPFGSMTLVLRTARDPEGVLAAAQREVATLQPDLALGQLERLEDRLAETLAERRLILITLSLFAGLAVVLAGIGIYGVTSLLVTQRTRELGVRMALGAEPGALRALVLRGGLTLAGAGMLLGAGLGLLLTRMMRGLLYGTAPADPLSFAAAALLLGLAAVLAGWLPARRATRVSPLVALKD
jgi:predicted lysophospholipase L1 biosynthesis ABC-type transport system permease subunit